MAGSIAINGQPLNGQFNFAYDLGGSVSDLDAQSFAFLNKNNTQNQTFLGKSIVGTQDFLAHQLTPLSSAIAKTQEANASMIPIAIGNFQNLMMAQTSAFTNAVNTGYGTINQNVTNTNNASTQVANSGGGGSYVCTAMYDEGLLSDEDYETLNEFKDVYMLSTPALKRQVMEYYRRAPDLVRLIKKSKVCKDILVELKGRFLDGVLVCIKDGKLDDAYRTYHKMMMVIVNMTRLESFESEYANS